MAKTRSDNELEEGGEVLIYSLLNPIRAVKPATTRQKIVSILYTILLAVIMGLVAKLVDAPGINPIFDDIGGRLGIWVFVATLLSVFSYSPRVAALTAFAFFGSMLTVYYVYTISILHFFPVREMLFWGICMLIAPLCAYLMWYGRGHGLFSTIIASLPITVILSEGYQLRYAYLPIHTHYYLIPFLMGIYLIMVALLLLVVPKSRKNRVLILTSAIILSCILIYLNVLGRIFGDMNGYL